MRLDHVFQGGRKTNPAGPLLAITEVTHDRISKRRASIHLQHVCVPALGRVGDVDGGRLHHARGRLGTHQKRLGHLPEEHRSVRDCRDRLLRRRIQPDVRRRRQLYRFLQLSPQPVARRSCAAGGCRRRAGGGDRNRLLGHVRLVLPDGIRGDRRVHCLWSTGREGQALVVLLLHRGADRVHLSDRRRLDLGRRLA